jgi:hypothetical protein
MAREMIKLSINDQNEYREAMRRLADANTRMAQRKVELEGMGLSPDEVKRVLDPMRSFYFQLQEEIERFEERG